MTTIERGTIPLRRAQIPQAAAAAARAFHHDAMFTYIFPDPAARPRQLRHFLQAGLRYGVRYGDVTTTPDGAGTAIWLTPGQTEISPMRMVRSGMAALPLTIGLAAFRRFLTFVSYGDEVHAGLMHEPHWYLLNLAVDPPRQRQGVGSALIAPALARADHAGQPCYLETNAPENLSFYARHGFKVAHEGRVPDGGPTLWAMVRRPRLG
jgi:ribosomal protein S18 acetylase RimI-like enzyme